MKNFKIIICFLVLIKTHYLFCSSKTDSSSYTLLAAGVLPIIYNEDHSKITALLGIQVGSREADYFGGFTKNQNAQDPLTDGASEWYEESLLEKILRWDLDHTKKHIQNNLKGYVILATQEPKSNNYGVMYMVGITPDIRDALLQNFASARKEIEKKPIGEDAEDLLEVSTLIEVNWNDLLQWSLPPKNRRSQKKLTPISIAQGGDIFVDNIILRRSLRDMLEGIARESQYAFQGGSKDFPLGVFIIGRRQDNKSRKEHFELCDLVANIQENLNKIIVDNLGLEDKKVLQAAAFQKITQDVPTALHQKGSARVEAVLKPIIKEDTQEEQTVSKKKWLALAVKNAIENKNQYFIDSAPSLASAPSPYSVEKEEQKKEVMPSDLWKTITDVFEKAVNIFQYIFNGIGAFFKGA